MENNNNNHIVPFAKTNFRNKETVFGIKTDDRRRHMYVIGKTGTGKSTLLRNMMIADIQAGNGVAVIDPHGEFAETVLRYVPKERIDDVIYFNPADTENPIAFNIAESVGPKERHLVASGLIGIFKKLWADSWGPRLEYVLRNTILAILEYEGSTLLDIMRMLSDKEFRKRVVANISDPVIKAFWVEEYAKYTSKFEVEAIAPIQNKVGQFLTNPLIRNIVGQPHSALNIRKIMDEKKILIMNLSKGRIGEDTSKLLGAMMITKIQLAAMSRINILEEDRQDFFLYVDEFQNFATESFADILSEARKYRLNLILAHQYINQLEDTGVKEAVLGNVGTLILFRIGAEDAEAFEKEFEPDVTTRDLVNLPNHKIYLKLMIDGVTSSAFSADTLPPIIPEEDDYTNDIINTSRDKYSKKREDVERGIEEWSRPVVDVVEEEKRPSNVKMYDTVCSRCNKVTQVPFEPDPNRSVYCKECYAEVQREQAKAENVKKNSQPLRRQPEIRIREEQEERFEPQKPRTKEGSFKLVSDELPEKEVSLSDAFNMGAVTFSGRKIQDDIKKHSKEHNGNSGVLSPGDTVKF